MGQRARLAVFISGSGSGLQALIDASAAGVLSAEIVLVVSSTRKAHGLERARTAGIPTFVFRSGKYESSTEASTDIMNRLTEAGSDYIALAGYLKLLPIEVVRSFVGKIVNIHPALLPQYGGQGMYGHHVHEAVLASGDGDSGPTVHLVDEVYDHGRILAQTKIPVRPDDTPDSLAARILIEEHKLYHKVIEKLIRGEYEHTEE